MCNGKFWPERSKIAKFDIEPQTMHPISHSKFQVIISKALSFRANFLLFVETLLVFPVLVQNSSSGSNLQVHHCVVILVMSLIWHTNTNSDFMFDVVHHYCVMISSLVEKQAQGTNLEEHIIGHNYVGIISRLDSIFIVNTWRKVQITFSYQTQWHMYWLKWSASWKSMSISLMFNVCEYIY